MARSLALLDKPSDASFGLVPIAVEAEGKRQVLGLAPPSSRGHGLTEAHLRDLIAGGHALVAEAELPPAELTQSTIALWLGDLFLKRVKDLGITLPPLPKWHAEVAGGTFFIGPAESMYPYLDRWTIAAFRRFCNSTSTAERKEIATLMQWVLPNRQESLAAAWESSPDKPRELALQHRVFSADMTTNALRARHEKLLHESHDEFADLRVVLFTGSTGVEREKVADVFAKRYDLALTTFRNAIAHDVPSILDPVQLKHFLMERGQSEVETSPLALTLSAVRSTKPRGHILVIDSLRHFTIRDTLLWLGPRMLYIVGVTTEDSKRWHRVSERGDNPNSIFRHPTETDIPGLVRDAHVRISESPSDSELQRIFSELRA